ncbi:MAG: ATP-binding cassette domain-containing protein, partial [Lactobacillales bacterium]|nr:ATP-binding cassette domain-containing protein [Lactobacillales bacterium]
MLKVENLSVYYDLIPAVRNVSFEVKPGEIVTLIGANGAGKTTILQTVSGLIQASSGKILFLGKEITKTSPQNIVACGISQVPDGRRIFESLTVK